MKLLRGLCVRYNFWKYRVPRLTYDLTPDGDVRIMVEDTSEIVMVILRENLFGGSKHDGE